MLTHLGGLLGGQLLLLGSLLGSRTLVSQELWTKDKDVKDVKRQVVLTSQPVSESRC